LNEESGIRVLSGLFDCSKGRGVLTNKYVPAYPFRLKRTFPPLWRWYASGRHAARRKWPWRASSWLGGHADWCSVLTTAQGLDAQSDLQIWLDSPSLVSKGLPMSVPGYGAFLSNHGNAEVISSPVALVPTTRQQW